MPKTDTQNSMTRFDHPAVCMSTDELKKFYETDFDCGLSHADIESARSRYGSNKLEEEKSESIFIKIVHHLSDVTSIILLIAMALSAFLAYSGEKSWVTSIVVSLIVVLNVAMALLQERSAEHALQSLKAMAVHEVSVLRAGEVTKIAAEELVVGDIMLLDAGSTLAADARIIEANKLAVDESMLTGESIPVEKTSDRLDEMPENISDFNNMLFSGTSITRGTARACVTAVGMQTELGHIANMLNHTEQRSTPLSRRLNDLGLKLSIVAVVGGLLTGLIAMLMHNHSLEEALFVGMSLAIAAVPEGLPVIVTLSLAHGIRKMADKQAIIRHIGAVETTGDIEVIASDKTGTLTQNKMQVLKFWTPEDGVQKVEQLKASSSAKGSAKVALSEDMSGISPEKSANASAATIQLCCSAVLANNAQLSASDEEGDIGDPTELALLRMLEHFSLDVDQIRNDYPRLDEDPFDSAKKTMAVLVKQEDGSYLGIIKGALDRLKLRNTIDRNEIAAIHNAFAAEALRVLAIGYKHFEQRPKNWKDELYDIELAGLVGIIDPPRPEATRAVAEAKRAGITTIMITGDHIQTAQAIAEEIGIFSKGDEAISSSDLAALSDEELGRRLSKIKVYARSSPSDKLRIIQAWQRKGATIAMTGDGVNDAPALKAADVGIAMGITGSDVSKNTADIILADDNFATILAAVRQGRGVYSNIVKAIEFLVSVNFAQIVLVLSMMLLGWGVPLQPEQLLIINLLADGIPGFFLAREKAEPQAMKQAPVSSDQSFWTPQLRLRVRARTLLYILLSIAVYTLGRFYLSADDAAVGTTMLFLLLGLGSMIDILAIRTHKPFSLVGLKDNPALMKSLLFAAAVVFACVLIEPLAIMLKLKNLNLLQWLLILAAIPLPLIAVETIKRWQLRRSAHSA